MKNHDLEKLYRQFQRSAVEKDGKRPLNDLSQRELQILIAIGLGIRPADAAERLGIAVKSFSTYRERLLDKLHLESNADLAILSFELGIVPSVLAKLKEEDDEHTA